MRDARQPKTDKTRRAARKLMRRQVALVTRNEAGVRAGRVLPLHDLRVALRRLRTLLKIFRKPLAGTSAAVLDQRLDALCESLGPARDTDVQLRFLRNRSVRRELSRQPGWDRFVADLLALQAAHRKKTARILAAAGYRRLKANMKRFLDVELRKPSPIPAPSVKTVAGRAVRKALERVESRAELPQSLPAERAHRLRIACRRARYTAEFFQPVLGKPAAALARRLKAVQDALGDVHDLDVLVARLRDGSLHPPPALRAGIRARRRKHARRFRHAWRRLQKL